MRLSLRVALTHVICGPLLACGGDFSGQFVLDGNAPELPKTVIGGAGCGGLVVDDQSLVIDPESKGIANIVLFPTRSPTNLSPEETAPPAEAAIFDQKDCQFTPRVLLVRAGQDVIVKSDDPCAHNVRSSFIRNAPFNFTVAPNDRIGETVDWLVRAEPLPMPIKCDIHPNMAGYWFISNHPYVAVTDADGKFSMSGLPAGEHKFRVWHERAGYIERSLKVTIPTDGDVVLPVIAVPVKEF